MHVLSSRVLLRSADFDGATAYWEERIGLVRSRDFGEAPHRGVVYFLGGGFLEVTETTTPQSVGDVRLWLQVADADGAHRQLRTRGAPVTSEPERMPWGLVEFTVDAPDGLVLHVVETPEDHPLRRRS